jgi:hypothetical protein
LIARLLKELPYCYSKKLSPQSELIALPLCAAGFEAYLLSFENAPNITKVKMENPMKLKLALFIAS